MPGKIRPFPLVLCAALGLLPACGQDTVSEDSAASDGSATSASINRTGTDGGMYYSCWTSDGRVSFALDGTSGYSVTWSNAGDFVCGKGWSVGSGRTVQWSGSYVNSGGGAYGLYGWTVNPVVEYYVVEKAGAAGSPAAGAVVGSYASDGAMYTLYRHQQVNQPCITGNACTFFQYIAVRQSPRTSGTITFQNHVNAWAQRGMRLGAYRYQLLATEAWNGSGSARAKIGACCTAP
jgi:endo-1,4-beta-xylanase